MNGEPSTEQLAAEADRAIAAGDAIGAAAALRQLHARAPTPQRALSLAAALFNLRQYAEAIPLFESVVFSTGASADVIEAYCTSLERTRRYERLTQVREALYAKVPSEENAERIVASLIRAGMAERVDDALQALLPRHPGNRRLLGAASEHLLRKGDFARGFDLASHRWAVARESPIHDDPPCARWDGRPFAGTLLVAMEQGLGEEILMASMFDDLALPGQACLIETDPRLVPLFRRRWPQFAFVARGGKRLSQAVAGGGEFRKVVAMELGALYRRGEENFPAQAHWLEADSARRDALRAAYRARWPGELLVGISWRSSRLFSGFDDKSLPLAAFRAMLTVPGVRFINLQYGDIRPDMEAVRAAGLPEPWSDPGIDTDNDIDALAAQIGALDLVVTSSNTTAHLAGALGVPCRVLLPRRGPVLWYWGYAGDTTPWYPAARLLRNPADDDWTALDALAAAEVAGARNPSDDKPDTAHALALVNAKRYREARPFLERLLEAGNTDLSCVIACAYARERTGDIEGAVRLLRALHEALPGADQAMRLVSALCRLGLREALDAELPALLAKYPDDSRLLAAAAEHTLASGDWGRGFDLAPHRWAVNPESSLRSGLPCPAWDGRPFEGTLLVTAEQGLGEELLGASMFPDLVALGQRACIAVDARLLPLCRRSFPTLEFVDRRGNALVAAARDPRARAIEALDLGRLFRRSAGDFPARPAILAADTARRDTLRAALQAHFPGKRLVGLSWRSHRVGVGDSKSIPPGDLLPLLSRPDCVFINLQYDAPEVDLAHWRAINMPVHRIDGIDTKNDLDTLAALIDALDLVVSCSNSTVHLAGALGKRTLAMIPGGRYVLWYWGYEGARSPWYPSVELFRGPPREPWRDLAADVSAALDAAATIGKGVPP